MADKQKILIVDDDTNIAELIELYLTKECFRCELAYDGKMALKKNNTFQPDLILLDIMLPGIDGYDVCREIRKPSSVLGLELGADDYMIKPFDSKELVARVKAVLRRYKPEEKQPVEAILDDGGAESVQYKDLTVSLSNYSVTYMGNAIEMPPKELELLYFLATHPNQVFTREQLLDRIWGYEYVVDTRTVDVHIKRLREKIKDHNEWCIATVWGIGYKFEAKRG